MLAGQGMSLSEHTTLIMMDHLGEIDLPGVTAALQRFASGTPCAGPQQEALRDIIPGNA